MQETGQCIPSLSFAEFFFSLKIHIVYTLFVPFVFQDVSNFCSDTLFKLQNITLVN